MEQPKEFKILKSCITGKFIEDLPVIEKYIEETNFLEKGGNFNDLYTSLGYVDDVIEKAVKGKSHLIKKRKLIYRGGKSFFATYWVNPDTGEKSDNVKEEIEETYEGKHDEFAIGDEIEFYDKKSGKYIKGKVKGIKMSKKYPEGIVEVDVDGRHVAVGLKSAKPIRKLDSTKETKKEEKIEEKPYDDMKDIIDISSGIPLGGSSGVMLYKEKFGRNSWVIKKSHKGDVNQLINEDLADKIYDTFNFKSPNGAIVKFGGEDVKVTPFIEDHVTLGSLEGDRKEEVYKELRKGFVLDALLANWDVIGANEDNILVSRGNFPVRIDNGGSMFYRARGDKKTFGEEVLEIDSFRDSTKNPSTAEVYKDITDEEIEKQVKKLFEREENFNKVFEKYEGKKEELEIIKKRLQWLKRKYVDKKDKKEAIYDYDKSLYGSKATADYFKDWDKFEIKGNKELKGTLEKRIREFEKDSYAHDRLKNQAESYGLSIEEYKIKLQQETEKFVNNSDFFRATGVRYLEEILLKDKRFKSQFEVDTSEGSYNPEYRAREELAYFGFPKTGDKTKRPIYGYFSNSKDGVINSHGTNPPPDSVSQYGKIKIKIKKESALKKATIVSIDSLGSSTQINAVPASKPHFSMFNVYNPIEYMKHGSSKAPSYTEVQYHDQLTVDDIEEIIFSTKNYTDEERALDEMNRMVEIGRKTSIPIRFY